MLLCVPSPVGSYPPGMENLSLYIGIAAAALVGWWIFKKLFKLAIYAGIIGVVAWFFYFQS